MNPYALIVAIVLAVALWFGGDHAGHKRGINAQKVADQRQFDQINAEREQQKATANVIYRKAQDDNLTLMVERDQLKTKLEKEHATNQKATDDLRTRYSGLGLRFTTDQGAGLGLSSRSAQGAGTDPASAIAPAFVQLPDALAADLQQLTFDADRLADDYRKCYGYATQVK